MKSDHSLFLLTETLFEINLYVGLADKLCCLNFDDSQREERDQLRMLSTVAVSDVCKCLKTPYSPQIIVLFPLSRQKSIFLFC